MAQAKKEELLDSVALRELKLTYHKMGIWRFPKIRGTLLGIPIIRNILFWGLYWGPLISGNYHIVNLNSRVSYNLIYIA